MVILISAAQQSDRITFSNDENIVSCKGIGIQDSAKFMLLESGILDFRILNTVQGICYPTNDWIRESKSHCQRARIYTWNPESKAWNPESRTVSLPRRARNNCLSSRKRAFAKIISLAEAE